MRRWLLGWLDENDAALDQCQAWLYASFMVKDFRHKGLERFFRVGSKAGILPQHAGRLRILLTALVHARQPQDMDAPGFGLHRLSGRFADFYAVSVSGNWRLIFQFDGQDVVKVDYLDYH